MSKVSRWRIYNRRFLVDPFQLRLVGVGVFHFVLVVFIFASALFLPIVIELGSDDISSPEVQAAAREFLVLHNRLWAPLFGAFILLVLHNIVITHRIAGPLFRLRKYLKGVGEGDLSYPIRIRRTDYLKKEVDVVNEMVESLRDRLAHAERQLEEANNVWTDLRGALDDDVANDWQKKINAMGERLQACRESVAAFKTGVGHPTLTERSTQAAEPVELKT